MTVATGKDDWKWGVAGVLTLVFMYFAYNAYMAINNPEDDIPPPVADYRDSYDLEHGTGGADGSGDVGASGTPGVGAVWTPPVASAAAEAPAAGTAGTSEPDDLVDPTATGP